MTNGNVFIFGPAEQGGGIASTVSEIIETGVDGWNVRAVNTLDSNTPNLYKFISAIIQVMKIAFKAKIHSPKSVYLLHFNLASRGSTYRKMLLATLAKVVGLKFVFLVHGGGFVDFLDSRSRFIRSAIVYLMRSASSCGSVSTKLAEQLEPRLRLSEGSMVRLPNGVDVGKIVTASRLRNTRVASVVYIGDASYAKGFDLFEKLASEHSLSNPEITFHVIGAIKPSTLVSTANFEFHGKLSRADALNKLSNCDCLVVASRIEALPMVILEAMQLRVPILGSSVGDIPVVISDGVNGLVFKSGSYEELRKQFRKILLPNGFRESLTNAAYKTWEESYSSRKMCINLGNFWNEATLKVGGKRRSCKL